MLQALVFNGPIKPAFGFNVPAGRFQSSSGRLGHAFDVQIIDYDHRVVFADGGRGFTCEFFSTIGDFSMNFGQLDFSLFEASAFPLGLSSLGRLPFARNVSLVVTEFFFDFATGLEGFDESSVGRRDEASYAQVESDYGFDGRFRIGDLSFRLDGDVESVHLNGDGDVPSTGRLS
jgi:hypothetical protein